MKNEFTIFTHEKFSEHLYLLTEGFAGKRVTMALAVGEDAALLMDAGLGANDQLRTYIEEEILEDRVCAPDGTRKRIFCVCTCGKPVHLGSAKLFDRAYLHPADLALAEREGLDQARRRLNLLNYCSGIPALEEYCAAHMYDNTGTEFACLTEDQVFELGGITVRSIHLPGHTEGSVVLYCEAEGWVFSGASLMQNTSLKTLDREGLTRFREALQSLSRILPEDVKIWFRDQIVPMGAKEVGALLTACDEVLEGKTRHDIPGESFFREKRNQREMRAHFAENCSIAYSTDLLHVSRSDAEDFRFYSREKVSEHVYVLAENNARDDELTLGLIVGSEQAMLIDTGMGMNGQLRQYVERITGDKHVIAASTHGNIDHIGGSILFEDRRLNARDWPEIGRATGTERRFGDIGNFCRQNEEVLEYCRRHWVRNENMEFGNIEAGERFDLGGVTVEVLYSGGHTPGHLSYYIPEEKILFCGDAVCRTALLRRLNREEFLLYAEQLEELYRQIAPGTRIYFGHLSLPQKPSDLLKEAQACREIAEGKTENDPPCNVLRPDKPGGLRYLHFSGNHGVIYEPGNLDRDGKTILRREIPV